MQLQIRRITIGEKESKKLRKDQGFILVLVDLVGEREKEASMAY